MGKVDKEAGIISGVSVITCGVEALGHGIYTDTKTLSTVKSCAESAPAGVQVKMDHGSGFRDIVGVLKNFRVELAEGAAAKTDCLRADLHLLKSHPAFNQICEMSQTMPASFGLSIAFRCSAEKIDDMDFVRCTELYSVDLVDAPAANPNGLFSKPVDSNTFSKTMLNELKDIWTKLGDTINALTAKPQAAELDAVKASLVELGGKVSGELTQLAADLATAQASIASLGADKAALETKNTELSAVASGLDAKLTEAVSALKITSQADATPADKITALQTFAALAAQSVGVPADKIPAGSTKLEAKTLTVSEFNKLSHSERSAFFKGGNKITE